MLEFARQQYLEEISCACSFPAGGRTGARIVVVRYHWQDAHHWTLPRPTRCPGQNSVCGSWSGLLNQCGNKAVANHFPHSLRIPAVKELFMFVQQTLVQMGWLGEHGLAWGPGREEIPTHDNKYQQCAPHGLDTQAYIHVCDRICMNVEVSKNKSGNQNKSQLISILQAYKCLVSSCPSLQTKLKCLSSDIFLAFHPGTCQLSRGCMASHRLSHRNFEVLSLTSRVGQPQKVTKPGKYLVLKWVMPRRRKSSSASCVCGLLWPRARQSEKVQELRSSAPNCQLATPTAAKRRSCHRGGLRSDCRAKKIGPTKVLQV